MTNSASAYTPEQLRFYEEYVGLPPSFRQAAKPSFDIAYLTALHQHHICAVPFENLVMHYSPSRVVVLDPLVLFDKIVTAKRGRGGYCMESTILLNHVLKGLGFDVYFAGARTRPRVNGVPTGDFAGWNHSVNIVTLPSGERFMLDVAFGGGGPTKPLPLVSGHVEQNLGTQQVRLSYATIPQQTVESQKLWHYEIRNSVDQEWHTFYVFSEIEFYSVDYEVMSFYVSQGKNWLREQILVVKFLKSDEGGVAGKIQILDGEVKKNTGGKNQTVVECKTEQERIRALEEHFGIFLTEEERNGIKGSPAEMASEVSIP